MDNINTLPDKSTVNNYVVIKGAVIAGLDYDTEFSIFDPIFTLPSMVQFTFMLR